VPRPLQYPHAMAFREESIRPVHPIRLPIVRLENL
jgi:hypothetical protein